MPRSLLVVVVLASFAIATGCNCGKKPVLNMDNPALGLPMQTLDFGPVPEGQMKDMMATIQNNGRAPMNLNAMIAADGSADFTLGPIPASVPANGQVQVTVHFIPTGSGSDTAEMVVSTNDPDHPSGKITLLGGPIQPELKFEPDPVTFNGAVAMMNNPRTVTLHSVGQANLHVMALGVAQTGNPDFSVDTNSVSLPVTLPPDASVDVVVDYSPFHPDAGSGWLQADSDDPVHLKQVELIPTQFAQCADGIDNDSDGLIDYPDDPGCANTQDDDEYNPPSCVSGAMQYCGSNVGACSQGVRVCSTSGNWGPCDGGVRSSPEICDGLDNDCNGVADNNITETCGMGTCSGVRFCIPDSGVPDGSWSVCQPVMNPPPEMCDGVDNNCNGMIDEGIFQNCVASNGCAGVQSCVPGGTGQWTNCTQNDPMCGMDAGTVDGGCNPNGVFTLDAGSISYLCTFGLVDFTVTQFQLQLNGAKVTCGPTFGANPLTGTGNATCPGGTFTATNTLYGQPGSNCDETYTITATFVGPNTITGTFTANYSGPACTGLGDDCVNQSWTFSAGR